MTQTFRKLFQGVLGGLILAALPGMAMSQQADLSEGRFIMFANHWDVSAGAFVEGPPPGSETACFAVGATTADGIHLRLISGQHYLDWSGETVTEFDTRWFSSARFMEANPGADILAELRILFRSVDSCDVGQS